MKDHSVDGSLVGLELSRRSFLGAAPGLLSVLPTAHQAIETVDAIALMGNDKFYADSFAANEHDSTRRTAEREAIGLGGHTSAPARIRFPGGRRFLAVELDTWECEFTPRHPLDIPPLTSPASLGGEQHITDREGWLTRDEARAIVADHNQQLLEDWGSAGDEWWIVVEVGICDLPYIVTIELTGEMGCFASLANEPLRIVREGGVS